MKEKKLQVLLEKRHYEEVIALTDGKSDPESLFIRASAFISLSKLKEAMNIFIKNRQVLFLAKPLRTLKSNFELRFLLKEFDEAYDDLKAFEEFPYVSQAVEEELAALPKRIRIEERNTSLPIGHSEEEIKAMLSLPKDDYELLSALNLIAKNDVSTYYQDLLNILTSNHAEVIKTYTFLLLVAKNEKRPVTWLRHGQKMTLVPAKCEPPFTSSLFTKMKNKLEEDANDPSLYLTAMSLLNNLTLELYPESVFQENDFSLVEAVLFSLANEYLSVADQDDALIKKFGLNKTDFKAKKVEFSNILKSAEPLHF